MRAEEGGNHQGGFFGKTSSARTLPSKKINDVECVQVGQYDHWLSHVVTGMSRKKYPLRNVEAFDMFCGEAAGVDMDDPMEVILGKSGGGKGKRGRGWGESAELRHVTVPKTYGGTETKVVMAAAPKGQLRRVWLRLSDLPWFLKYIRKAYEVANGLAEETEKEDYTETEKEQGTEGEDEGRRGCGESAAVVAASSQSSEGETGKKKKNRHQEAHGGKKEQTEKKDKKRKKEKKTKKGSGE